MRRIVSLGVILSAVALALGVLEGLYIAFPLGLIALAMLFLQSEPSPQIIEKVKIPNRQDLDDKLESIDEEFEEKRYQRVDVEKVKDFFDRIGKK